MRIIVKKTKTIVVSFWYHNCGFNSHLLNVSGTTINETIGDFEFLISNNQYNFDGAVSFCTDLGTQIASISSSAEQIDLVRKLGEHR